MGAPRQKATLATLLALFVIGGVAAARQDAPGALTGAAKLQADALAVGQHVQSDLAMQFLDAARAIEDIEPRTLLLDRQTRAFYTPEEAAALPEEQREALRTIEIGTDMYFGAFYGTPIAYARPIDIVGQSGVQPAFLDFDGKRIMDFGHGGIGQLRMMGACGADVVGVDVGTFQPALYREPGDQGEIPGLDGGPAGRVTLVTGQWPGDEATREKVGGGFDLIISKNTLKRGYIHPERETDPRQLVHLGVDDREFLKAAFEALKPGGLFIIYNLSPAPAKADEPYKPWADGRCPFALHLFSEAGFRLMAYDVDDSRVARDMARALKWDENGMDVQNDLFARVTIAWKPTENFVPKID